MRIALATSSYAPHVGGVEEHVRNVAAALVERGHDVVVWTVDRAGDFAVTAVDGVEVWNLPAPLPARSARDALRFAVRVPRAAFRWIQAFRRFRPDVVHVQCFGPNGTYARYLAARTGTPLIVSSHGETIADDAGVFEHSRLARSSLAAALTQSAAVTGCSAVVLDDLRARFGLAAGAGVVVPNGIDLTERSEPTLPDTGARYIAAVGRLQEVKGFDLLVEAFARASLDDDISLVIGGDGPEEQRLRALASRHGIADRVRLPGRLNRSEVWTLMANATAVVVPSRFEAFGITALEAWRAGAPLIATNRGGPAEFVTDGVDGLLCDPTDVAEMALRLESLFADAARAERIASAGRERVRSFTWEHTSEEYEHVYRALAVPTTANPR